MIRIKGILNIIWISDVWNDEGCAPYLVSNEAVKEKQHERSLASILDDFQENDLTYMIFLRLHQGYSVKTNVANDDYYT